MYCMPFYERPMFHSTGYCLTLMRIGRYSWIVAWQSLRRSDGEVWVKFSLHWNA